MRVIAIAFILLIMAMKPLSAREQIRIVGSSTVFPFVATASERFSDKTGYKAPIVESIGTGAGFMEFCKGQGVSFPDMVNASRAIKESEKTLCASNGIVDIIEIPIGKDGVILASNVAGSQFPLQREDIFLALAKFVPVNGTLQPNPYTHWKQINPALPNTKIEVYGPAATSGTRDAFVELAMEPVCVTMQAFKTAYADAKERSKACHMMREDGAFIEAGENDNLIVQKLGVNPNALGIFGYSYLEQNGDTIAAHSVDGVMPAFQSITDNSYPVARSLYVYAKKSHIDAITGLKPFLAELTSDSAVSNEGYLSYKGLIPVSYEARFKARVALGLDTAIMSEAHVH